MTSFQPTDQRTPKSFWILGAILTLCVFLCTKNRDRIWAADAWEHHRAVVALTEKLWQPGNPTLATDDPSIRYSPYTVTIALFCRLTGVDPFRALSLAATLNTALLVVGVSMLLKYFRESASATATLIVMVGLWGGPPGYANSYALADLPWHQVNPSAFSFALVLIYWSLFLAKPTWGWLAAIPLATIATLDHPMTGVFGIFGLIVLAVTGPDGSRAAMKAIGIGIIALTLCFAWPWYSFLAAVRSHRDNDYWFNPMILRMMLFDWCTPALLCGLLALVLRNRPIVWRCAVAAGACYVVGILAMAIKSPTLARFPMPAMIFLHLPVGILIHQSGVLRPNQWAAKLRSIAREDSLANARAIIETAAFALVLYFLIPQVIAIGTEWHLGRPYLAQIFHKPDKVPHVKPLVDELLQKVGPHDVILSDRVTSWPIPSSNGRVVAALHLEAFVLDQPQRKIDVDAFFDNSTNDAARRATLQKYHVKWIVLNRDKIPADVFNALLRDPAVVVRKGSLVLMDADAWMH